MAKVVKKTPRPNETKILNSKELGLWVKHIRTKSELTRQDAANFCNISYNTFNNIENGKESVSIEKYLKVLAMLGLTLHIEE